MANPQLNGNGELHHLLTIDGLPREILVKILDTAAPFAEVSEREVKKVPLRGATVAIQGFGNAGAIAARLFAEKKAKIVAISDVSGLCES